MAAGIEQLRKIQLGLEVTPGTGVAATVIWRGESDGVELTDTVKRIPEHIGILNGADRDVITRYESMLQLKETPATFEQLGLLVAASFGGPTTGSADGAGSDYIYTTNIPYSSLPTIKTFTVEGGDNKEENEFEYGHCTEWKLTGAMDETVNMSGTLRGQRAAQSSYTGALSPIAVNEMLTGKGKVYLDAIGGSYGGTQVTNQILAFELNFKPTLPFKQTMDGSLDPGRLEYTGHEITGRLTFEHDTAVLLNAGAKADFQARTPRKLRIKIEGAAFTSAGTTYSVYTAIFDLPIKYTKVSPFGSVEGNTTVDMEFESRANTTAGDSGKIILVNQIATLL